MLGVVLLYLGLIAAFLGGVSCLRPLSFFAIRTRRQATMVLVLGLMVVATGGSLPAKVVRVATPRTELDQFAPVYQFSEFHSIRITAPKEQVYQALKSVTAEEIALFRTLTWLRRFGLPGPESILNPPPHVPLLNVATRTSFLVLAEEPNREIVLGTLLAAPPGWRPSGKPTPDGFRAFFVTTSHTGFAPAAMNFWRNMVEKGVSNSAGTVHPLIKKVLASRPPIAELIGFNVEEISDGRAVGSLECGPQHANPMGTLHGGVLCDLADAAMGMAFASTLASDESFTAMTLSINFFRPVWQTRLRAEARVVNRGKNVGYVECDVTDQNSKQIAKANSTCFILRGEHAKAR